MATSQGRTTGVDGICCEIYGTSATPVLRGCRAVQARPQRWDKGRNFKVNFVTVKLEVILVSILIL